MSTLRHIPLAAILLAAACSSAHPDSAPTPTPTVPRQSPSPSPSRTLASAVTVDDAARQGCRLLIQAKADTADVDASDPLLRQAADALTRSQHFSRRSDGQALGRDLDIYAAGRGSIAAAVAVEGTARRVERDCAAEGAEK